MALTYPPPHIESVILLLRGHKVLLDADLAALYGVTTKRLNEQVRRNRSRFPEDFMFRLTSEEVASLRSQFATSNKGRGGRRYAPFAFTEQGVAMNYIPLTMTRTFVRISTIITPHCFGSRARGRSSGSGPCFFGTRR